MDDLGKKTTFLTDLGGPQARLSGSKKFFALFVHAELVFIDGYNNNGRFELPEYHPNNKYVIFQNNIIF